jgi:hypothetical protein
MWSCAGSGYKPQQTDQPADQREDHGAHGVFDDQARG